MEGKINRIRMSPRKGKESRKGTVNGKRDIDVKREKEKGNREVGKDKGRRK
jgi:hypothetical protein